MANSPTMCQLYVQSALEPIRKAYPIVRMCHYMDDILIAAPYTDMLESVFASTAEALKARGLLIAPEKVQRDLVGRFLGAVICPKYTCPQKVQLRVGALKTLNDFQHLLGDINWLHPYLKITTAELRPLFKILEGDPRVTSPRYLTEEARLALRKVEKAIEESQLQRIDYSKPLLLCVLPTEEAPTAVLWQEGPLLWVHAHASISKVIQYYPAVVATIAMIGIKLSLMDFALQPQLLIQTYNPKQIQILCATVDDWAVLITTFNGRFDNYYPSDKLLQFITHHPVVFPK